MKRAGAAWLAIASACVGVTTGACLDLFHSTADVLTACELDAAATGCRTASATDARAADAGGVEFCAWTPTEARQHAEHACAWLGACETPMGQNAFGSCMIQATLAYDCAANPNHRVKGATHDLWACLSSAQSCGDVDACVFPAGPLACQTPGEYTGCGAPGGAAAARAVRIECADGGVRPYPGAHGENCALWGQTCASTGTAASCTGSDGLACAQSGCDGTPMAHLHWCVDGGDMGMDCSGAGGQRCDGFPSRSSPQWIACVAESDALSSGPCAPDATATCNNGLATSCPSGVPERLDCRAVLGTASACVPGPLAPPFDWTSPCQVTPPRCTADTCSGTVLSGCARGATVSLDCATQGLGHCRMVLTDMGTQQHAACAPP